jgi:hypothetical protein
MKALLTLALALLLAGCAAGQGSAGRSIAEETTANGTEETTVYKEETTVLAGEEGLPRPPDSTLSYGGREVKGLLGTYEWPSGQTRTAADAPILIPRKQKTLTVPSGSEMVFRYGGQSPLKTVNAAAYTFDPIFDKKLRSLGIRANADYSSRRSLKVHGSGVERTIPAELPPGEYVLEVLIKERQGDAAYYFRVMVE